MPRGQGEVGDHGRSHEVGVGIGGQFIVSVITKSAVELLKLLRATPSATA
ncbi:MAG TPA: hypothetical protein VMK12_31460 [Anaeromyxobacteraceae bacterium]|nr:hypothetical protein [Anaeromyxobacteraceae bacterium]